MRQFHAYALGNAIVDILLEISAEEFNELDLKKGSMSLVDVGTQRALLERFRSKNPVLVSGGSIANSLIAFAQLGGKAAFSALLGDDRYGLHYESECEYLGIELSQPALVDATTGTCVIVVTPDAERTMQTNLGISAQLGAEHVRADLVQQSEWLVIEGYILSTESGQQAAFTAVAAAKQAGTKVAVTFSAEFIVNFFGDALKQVTASADLIIANIEEARAFTACEDNEAVLAALTEYAEHVVITDGSNGALIAYAGERIQVPAVPTVPKDATGAGDMFAGAYLYGICHGEKPARAARGACFLAHKVIQQIGARLHTGVKAAWDEALA